jgi:DNA repair protein RecN (Recombination protein N)
MLLSLGIRDFVLIDRLDLELASGLSVLTGETGAGKSILLDSLSLALGGRAEPGQIRADAAQAVITAEFDVAADHPARKLLAAQELDAEGALILRRVVTREGRTRASINDQAVSVGLLREVGACLAEIQGQFEGYGLLDPATHRATLDAFAGAAPLIEATGEAHAAWQAAKAAREAAIAEAGQAKAQEEYLRHAVGELDQLGPKPGEEAELASQRAMLQQRDKLIAALQAANGELVGERGAEAQLGRALRALSRLGAEADAELEPIVAALDRAASEVTEGLAQLTRLTRSDAFAEGRLEAIEERLFALRGLARKHQAQPDELAALRDRLADQLSQIEDGEGHLKRLSEAEQAAKARYRTVAQALTEARTRAALKLDKAVTAELPPLKLDKARFRTRLEALDEPSWGPYGLERVTFEVATNPGSEPGPLNKIASGGELSRFMLALKLVLAATNPVPTLVFDEVDSGIGGAVAAAVGERLARLGQGLQVLVVTHSPQVAALGSHHWRVAKLTAKGQTATRVERLDGADRREEIARMLSGAVVTDEARAAADSLLLARAS